MSQNDFSIDNADGATVRLDMNGALQALASTSSGTSAPGTTYANQLWMDTTNSILKQRNAANTGWVELFRLDQTNSFAYRDKLAIGSSLPASQDGLLHVHNGSAGSVSAVTNSFLVLENGGNAHMQFLVPSGGASAIWFGDEADNDVGFIYYDHSTNAMQFWANTGLAINIDSNKYVQMGGGTVTTALAGSILTVRYDNSGGIDPATNNSPAIGLRNGSTANQINKGIGFAFAIGGADDMWFYAVQASGTNSDNRGEFRFYGRWDSTRYNLMSMMGDGRIYFPNVATTAGGGSGARLNSGDGNQLLRDTSSLLYKTDVEDVAPEYSARIYDLRPIFFRSTASADNPAWSWWGLGAEEVAEIDPRLADWGFHEGDYEDVTVLDTYNQDILDDDGAVLFRQGDTKRDGEGNALYVSSRRLREGAEISPIGVKYDRVGVLTLHQVQLIEPRVANLEARVSALEAA